MLGRQAAVNEAERDAKKSGQELGGRRLPTRMVLRLVLFATASGLLFGIDLASIGGALEGLTGDLQLSVAEEQAVVSGAKAGSIVGSIVGGAVMAAHGRRTAVAVAAVPFLLGPVMLGFSGDFLLALCGRLVMGLGVGMASVATPCFLSEVAPREVRGGLVALYELAIALGFLVASVTSWAIESSAPCTGGCWRYQAGLVPFLAALPLLLAVALVPESPRWTLLAGHCGDDKAGYLLKALEAIKLLGSAGAEERLAAVKCLGASQAATGAASSHRNVSQVDSLLGIWERRHEALGSPIFPPIAESSYEGRMRPRLQLAGPEKVSVLGALCRTLGDTASIIRGGAEVPPFAFRSLWLAVLAAVLDQVCASTSILVYSQHLLKEAGVTSAQRQDFLSMAVAAAKVAGVVLGLFFVNRIGRRPLLGWGGALSALSILLLSAGAATKSPVMLLLGMCSFILVFVATWGVGYWIVVTEVTTAAGPRYGAACQAVATAMLFASGWATSFTFVWVSSSGPWALLVYGGAAVLMTLYAGLLLPETRGLSLEQCADAVEQLPVERWLNKYKCTGALG